MRRQVFSLPLILMSFVSATAWGEDLQGMIRIVGPQGANKVLLTDVKEFTGPRICPSPLEERVKELDSLIIKLTGTWKQLSGTDKCFDATDFTILKTSNGHDVVVGNLTQKDGVYRVTGDDGKATVLGYAPKNLKKLEGKKVILDLQLMDGQANLTDTVYKALSYSEYP